MNARLSLHRVCAFAMSIAAAVTLWQFSSGVHAQKAEKPKTAHPPSSADKKAAVKTEAASEQRRIWREGQRIHDSAVLHD